MPLALALALMFCSNVYEMMLAVACVGFIVIRQHRKEAWRQEWFADTGTYP